jgi:hypothetical protein
MSQKHWNLTQNLILAIQFGVICVFVLLPISILSILFIFEFQNGTEPSMILVAFMSFGEVFDFFVIVYFVQPYRKAFIKIVRFSNPETTSRFCATQTNLISIFSSIQGLYHLAETQRL